MVYEDQPMSIDTYYYVKDSLLSVCVFFLINEFIYLSHATLINHNIHVVSGTTYICMYSIGCMLEGMQSDCNIMMLGGKDLTVIWNWYNAIRNITMMIIFILS